MPTVTRDGVDLHYDTAGDGETVAFVADTGFGAWLWGWQQPAVVGQRKTLVWDLPGTGESDDPPGQRDVDALAADFEAVLSAAGVDSAHVVGAGLGGMVALRYAREYDRARTLTLCCTAASGADFDSDALRELHPDERDEESLADSLSEAFSPAFLDAQPDLVTDVCEWRRAEDATGEALDAQLDALERFEADPLYELTLPTLVLFGEDDPVVPTSAARRLAEELPRGQAQAVAGRHLCFVEHSRAVTDRILAHVEVAGRT